ncbi:hypothetical protein FACS1894191_6570 [Clostridia bacterium]|nr:hypothetical protein FACS1894191_6570 [Clostridia bacterium]
MSDQRDMFEIITGAVVKNEDGKYLMVQELKESAYLLWNLPLGHLDNGELLENAAIREVKEESGYNVKLVGLLPVEQIMCDGVYKIRIIFIAEIIDGEESERDETEIADVKFYSIDEIKQMLVEGKVRNGERTVASIMNAENGKISSLDSLTSWVGSDK